MNRMRSKRTPRQRKPYWVTIWIIFGGIILLAGIYQLRRFFVDFSVRDAEVVPSHRYLTWNPNSNSFAVTGDLGLFLYSFDLQKIIRYSDIRHALVAAWSPDGKTLLTNDGGLIVALDGDTLALRQRVPTDNLLSFGESINFVAWKPNENILSIIDSGGKVRIWSVSHLTEQEILFNEITTFQSYTRWSFAQTLWSPNGNMLAVTCDDGAVRVWDTTSGHLLQVLQHSSNNQLGLYTFATWSPNNEEIATVATADNIIKIWDVTTGKAINSFQYESANIFAVKSIDWHPNGKQLALADGSGIQLWDATGQFLTTLESSKGDNAIVVRWSPNGNKIAAIDFTGWKSSISVWDTLTGKLVSRTVSD